ncbi:protein of unknown function [Burkholderia multivorans]
MRAHAEDAAPLRLDARRADRHRDLRRAAVEPCHHALRPRAARVPVARGRNAQPGEPSAAPADRRAADRAARSRRVVQRRARTHPACIRAARSVQCGRRARAAHAGQHPDRPDAGRADEPRPLGRADAPDAAVESRGIRAAARDRQRHAVPVAQRPRRARVRPEGRVARGRSAAHAGFSRDPARRGPIARRTARRRARERRSVAVPPRDDEPADQRDPAFGGRRHAARNDHAARRADRSGGRESRRTDRRRAARAHLRALLSARGGTREQHGEPRPRAVDRQGGRRDARRRRVRRIGGRLQHVRVFRCDAAERRRADAARGHAARARDRPDARAALVPLVPLAGARRRPRAPKGSFLQYVAGPSL